MKAESNTMPQSAFLVEQRGDLADISFFENAVESQKEGKPVWAYDYYILTVPFRPDLEATIAENYAAWIKASKEVVSPEPTIEEKVQIAMTEVSAMAEKVESSLKATRALIRGDEITPEKLLELKEIYPVWAPGLTVKEKEYYNYGPKLYQVNDGQGHKTQSDWPPDVTKSLFKEVTPPNVIPFWIQPTGSQDAYKIGDKRIYPPVVGGKVWTSKINGNTSIPDGDVPYNRFWTDK